MTALKDKLPTLEKGSANLGDQLRELRAVVAELCDAVEAHELALTQTPPADEADAEGDSADDKQEAPDPAFDLVADEKAPAAAKTTPRAAAKAVAK